MLTCYDIVKDVGDTDSSQLRRCDHKKLLIGASKYFSCHCVFNKHINYIYVWLPRPSEITVCPLNPEFVSELIVSKRHF